MLIRDPSAALIRGRTCILPASLSFRLGLCVLFQVLVVALDPDGRRVPEHQDPVLWNMFCKVGLLIRKNDTLPMLSFVSLLHSRGGRLSRPGYPKKKWDKILLERGRAKHTWACVWRDGFLYRILALSL